MAGIRVVTVDPYLGYDPLISCLAAQASLDF